MSLRLLDRAISFQRCFVTLTGSVNAALMLSQAVYWHIRTDDPQGHFYKSQAEWEEETGLSRYEQESARKTLRALGFWHEERVGMPAKLYFRIDEEKLQEMLDSLPQSSMRKSRILERGKPADKIASFPQAINEQQITTEITTQKGKRTELSIAKPPAARTPQQAPPFEDFSDNSNELEPLKREIERACGITVVPDHQTEDLISRAALALKVQRFTPQRIREIVKANPTKSYKPKFFAEDILSLHAVTQRASESEPEDLRTCKADNCVGGTVREWLESGKYRDKQCPECKGKGKVPVQIRARQEEAARRRAAANVDQLLSF